MTDDRVRANPAVSRSVADGLLLLAVADPEGGEAPVVTLNEAGTRLWAELTQPRSLDELAAVLTPDEPAVARNDVAALVGGLQQAGLVAARSPERVGAAADANDEPLTSSQHGPVPGQANPADEEDDEEESDPERAEQAQLDPSSNPQPTPWAALPRDRSVPEPTATLFRALTEAAGPDATTRSIEHWGRVEIAALTDQGTLSLAGWAESAGRIEPGPVGSAALRKAHADQQRHALANERLAVRVVALLDRAGIDHRVLKGMASAHLDLPDPSARGFADIDLLVGEAELPAAVELMLDAGLTCLEPIGRSMTTNKSLTFLSDRGVLIDLHQRLYRGPLGFTTTPSALLAEYETFEVGGRRLRALDSAGRLLHALGHRILTPSRWGGVWDAHLLMERVDVAELRARATGWRHRAVTVEGLDAMATAIPSDRPTIEALKVALDPPHWERWLFGPADRYAVNAVRRRLGNTLMFADWRRTLRYARGRYRRRPPRQSPPRG